MTSKVINTNTNIKPTSKNINEDCLICCEKYTKVARPKIECPSCDLEVCKSCVKRYLLEQKTPKCMKCNVEWGDDFCSEKLGSWMRGKFRIHKKKLLFDMEKARLPETMPAVEQFLNLSKLNEEKLTLYNTIEEMQKQVWALKRKREEVAKEINRISRGENPEDKEKKVFIRACPDNNCNGFLSTQWKCGVCEKWSCPKCFEIIGKDKEEANHECDPNTLATAQMMKKETKPCPSCSAAIFKIEGCDQMWCTQCKTPFSWRTGRIVNGTIHNPHYHQWQRENGVGVLQPGARLCGGLPSIQQLRTALVNLEGNTMVRSIGGLFINRQSWILSLIKLNEGYSYDGYRYIRGTFQPSSFNECSSVDNDLFLKFDNGQANKTLVKKINKRFHSWELVDGTNRVILVPPKPVIAILKILHSTMRQLRAIQHFNLVELDDLRRNCQRQQDNKDLRIKYILKTTNEEAMKTQLIKRDTKWKKMNSILQIYELYSQVSEECLRTIYNVRTLKGIIDALKKKEKVRIYCNEALLNISKTYNQVVNFIRLSGYSCQRNYKGKGRDGEGWSSIKSILTNRLEKCAWIDIIEKKGLDKDDEAMEIEYEEHREDMEFVETYIGACNYARHQNYRRGHGGRF